MDILQEFFQNRRIQAAGGHGDKPAERSRHTESDFIDLERRVDALTLACQALWEITRAHAGLNEQAILHKMQEIDLRDGKADGRIAPKPTACPDCNRTNNGARTSCVYCGKPLPSPEIFNRG